MWFDSNELDGLKSTLIVLRLSLAVALDQRLCNNVPTSLVLALLPSGGQGVILVVQIGASASLTGGSYSRWFVGKGDNGWGRKQEESCTQTS